jgi:hypothetical protein
LKSHKLVSSPVLLVVLLLVAAAVTGGALAAGGSGKSHKTSGPDPDPARAALEQVQPATLSPDQIEVDQLDPAATPSCPSNPDTPLEAKYCFIVKLPPGVSSTELSTGDLQIVQQKECDIMGADAAGTPVCPAGTNDGQQAGHGG